MVEDYDGGLAQALQEYRELTAAYQGGGGEPPEGRGEAADGMVVVTAASGRISTVELNPRVLRLPSEDLAAAFAEAANAALADLESKQPQFPVPDVDPARIEAQLVEAREQGMRQLQRYNQSLSEALAQMGR